MEERTVSYRRLIGRFATGVAVILSEEGDRLVGLTANSLTSASLDPLLLLFCARNESKSAAVVLRSGRFSVNVLTAHQEHIARHFSGSRDYGTKFDYHRGERFAWLPDAAAVFRCEVEAVYPGGDQRIIVGRVIDMFGPQRCDRPLVYHRGRYTHLELHEEESTLVETKQP
jgi:flavin reductase (DIM6/NTAB) family NADH-FMN oxidoreductase RutF